MSFTSKNYKYDGQWLDARRKRISATDIPVISGTNKYKSKIQLIEEKIGKREPKNLDDVPEVQFGNDCEFLFEHLVRQTSMWDEWVFDNPGDRCIQVSDIEDWASCTVDYFGYDETDPHTVFPFEVKTGPIGRFIQVPDMYQDQLLWQMFVCGKPHGYLAAITIPDDGVRQHWLRYDGYRIKDVILGYVRSVAKLKVFKVERDEARIDFLVQEAKSFLERIEEHREKWAKESDMSNFIKG